MELKLDAYGRKVITSYLLLAVRAEALTPEQFNAYSESLTTGINAQQAAELGPIIGPLFHPDTVKEVRITNLFMMFALCGG